jgi:two-component system NtrC family sensor kinase
MSTYTGLLEGTFSRSGDAICLIDRAGFVDCNAAALRLFGFTDKAEFLQHHPGDFAPERQPDGRLSVDVANSDMAAAFANGHALIEWQHRRRDGTLFYSEVMLVGFSLDGRQALTATIRDITKRKEAELAVRTSRANLQLILDSLPVRVAWIDRDHVHRYCNRPYADFIGCLPADVLGRPAAAVLGEDQDFIRGCDAAVQSGEVTSWQGWWRYASQEERHVQRTYTPHYGPDGSVDGCIVFELDTTDQKRGEQELIQQREALHQTEKMGALGSLLAGVAHELNNPLSVVLAQTELLNESASDPKVTSRGAKIHAAAERCARIVRSFLAIARQRPPAYAPVEITTVVRSALELTQYGLAANGIAVRVDLQDQLPQIRGDADQLGQILMNLIVNAQQSLQEREGPRRLEIQAKADAPGWLDLRVVDNGSGVPAELRSRIFDPFFTTKPVGKGTGVGLSICLGIVQAHGGSMSIEDTPGGGATFMVRLPTAAEDGEVAPQPASRQESWCNSSVLIVDDEPDIAKTLAEIIGPMVGRVDMAGSGTAALGLLAQRSYDLIVSDLRMPDLDGPGLLRRVRSGSGEKTPSFLFVTGDTLYHKLDQLVADHGVSVLEKPFLPREVRERVTALLSGVDGA